MSVYRFKVYFEDDENVYREIEIRASQTFEHLHNAIQNAINFDNVHPASFFISNDTWRKGKEIKLLRDKQSGAKQNGWMHEVKIASYIEDPHQKIIYEFDPDGAGWVLYLELVKILPDSPITYPRINKSVGNPPSQYKITTAIDVKVDEDEDEEEEVEESDDYVKSMSEAGGHYEESEEEEVEHEIKAHAKSSHDDEEGSEEGTIGDEEKGESFEESGSYEEEEL